MDWKEAVLTEFTCMLYLLAHHIVFGTNVSFFPFPLLPIIEYLSCSQFHVSVLSAQIHPSLFLAQSLLYFSFLNVSG